MNITEREVQFAMTILDASGGGDAEEQTLRQLRRDMSDKRARKVLRVAIARMAGA